MQQSATDSGGCFVATQGIPEKELATAIQGGAGIRRVVLVERPSETRFTIYLQLVGRLGWWHIALRSTPVGAPGRIKSFADYWTIRSTLDNLGYRGLLCSIPEGDPRLVRLGLTNP